ncbi:hypothetical protein KAR91_13585 [Candidatus Pacearchaeota archaeon]|nr:hypothetical protein [Candidatus Pacearchaeota archaeon]
MFDQIGAVTGLKRKSGLEDIINAETPYLPAKVQAKKDREFADKTFAANEAQADRQFDIDAEEAHEARKQGNRATNLGYANLGVNVLNEAGAFSDLYDVISGMFS